MTSTQAVKLQNRKQKKKKQKNKKKQKKKQGGALFFVFSTTALELDTNHPILPDCECRVLHEVVS